MRRTGIALLLTALVAGTAGCGSSDDGRISDASSATPDVAADTSTPAPTAEATPSTASTPAATTATSPSGGVSTEGGQGSEGDGTPGSNAGVGSGSGDTAACTSANLKASLDFAGGGAAGSTTGNLVLRNAGSASCTLYGYPGVSLVDGAGHQLGAAAARTGASAKTVTVRAGDSAFASLKITDALNYDAATCDPTDATGLRIYPPGEKAALFVEHTAKACAKDVGILTVGPMSTDG